MDKRDERSVKIRIPEFVYKKYKVICAERDVSMPKMTAQLLRDFIIHDEAIKKTLR